MLKPKTNKEELKRLRSTLMTGAEIRLTYATETCCNKNCIPNLIRGGRPGKVFNSSSDTSSAARYDNYLYCQQIGVPTEDIPSIAFDQFLKEIRQPIHALQAGAVSEAEANEQLRYYLVQKFTENRIYDDSDNKHNHLYLYQLHSLSRGIITVCKMAYIIITGVSVQAIEYSQRLVRNNVSAESIILGKSDQPTKTKGDSLKEAFEQFHLDYYRYQQNINHFVDIMKIPDSPTAFMCVTFLAEWFELAGEQEPNADEIHIDPISEVEVWNEYKSDPFILSHDKVFGYASFTKIWREVFPKVKIREYKNVTGKCEICEACKKMMSQSKSKALRVVVRQYKLMHRAYYMGEKLLYYQRRAEATNSNNEIGSIIIDKMGTHATQLPLLSNLNSLNSLFGVAVTGAISHGTNETTFYLSTPNVSTGASYTIHCILSELRKLYAKNNRQPLKKVYIEIDGASDNVAKAVIASCEHLVFKKFCPLIILARLPVGHTHEDIDSRFGKIWIFVRERHIYTFDGFCTIISEAFGKSDQISVVPVFAILDYKAYYDQFIDANLVDKYSRMEFTQLYFKIQPVGDVVLEGSASSNLLVRTNYKKFGQEYTVFLRENADEGKESNELPYVPVLLKSAWIPENAKNAPCLFPQFCNNSCPCKERAPGIGFLVSVPTGYPQPMDFEKGWFNTFSTFIDKVDSFFRRRKGDKYAQYWQRFATHQMPTSELVGNFVTEHDIDSPLGQYLFCTTNFSTNVQFQSAVTLESTAVTGFSNDSHRIRASIFDLSLMDHIEQNKQTIPWKGHREAYKNWEFDKPFMLQRILLTRGTGERKKSQKATCVAWCKQDINEGPLFQIVFDDRSAPTTLTPLIFKQARAAYLALPQQEVSGDRVEPPPRLTASQRRQNQVQQQSSSSSSSVASATLTAAQRRSTLNQEQQQSSSSSAVANAIIAAAQRLPPNQEQQQSSSSSAVASATLTAARSTPNQEQQQSSSSSAVANAIIAAAQRLPPNQEQQQSSSSSAVASATLTAAQRRPNRKQQQSASSFNTYNHTIATVINAFDGSSTAPVDCTFSNHSNVKDTATASNNNILRNNLLCCAIHECSEFCEPDTQGCTECPNQKRTYLYCPLHMLHSSHNNQSSARRINTIVPASTNNNEEESINYNNSIVLNVRGTTSRRKRCRPNDGDEEYCMCGCNTSYDFTTMSDCKGANCTNRVHRRCVPNSWLCNICKNIK